MRAVHVATPDRPESVRAGAAVVTGALGVILLALWAGAFMHLRTSSYWIDELWTVFVIDRPAGLGEVFRRTLTDTHPPLYYLLLHPWAQVLGDGEASLRLFSAICAVGAGVIFVAATGAAFSLPARLFGAAAGACSVHWFFEAQNARNYTLAMLALVGLMVCALQVKRRSLEGQPVGWGLCAAVALVGAAAAFTHYYLLVATGLVFFWLLVAIPDLRLRATVIAAGGLILAGSVAYIMVQHRHMQWGAWFQKDSGFILASTHLAVHEAMGRRARLALVLLGLATLYGLWRGRTSAAMSQAPPRARPLADWTTALSVFLLVGLPCVGLAITLLVAPSLSNRNLLIAHPGLWFIAAWLYDRAIGPAPSWSGVALGAAACALLAVDLVGFTEGRLLQRNEDWRSSAQYVTGLAACRGRPVPVVHPAKMGPANDFFRDLTEHGFYGYYYRGGGRLIDATNAELQSDARPDLGALLAARARGQDPCPVLAWAVHDIDDAEAEALAQALARRPDVGATVVVRRTPSFNQERDGWRLEEPAAYVFERAGG